ncbi:MAG: bifunctional folylpolyglutamate synthase/dihydrofolate synthase [Chloroflexota bacterium]
MNRTDSLPPDALEPDAKYREVLKWVWSFSARPRTPEEMSRQRATKLDRMRALLAGLDHPEREFPSVLVAGTKGKGSTLAMLDACLRAQGVRTGRYTSPHLVNWRERTCVDAQPIGVESVVALAGPVRRALDNLAPALGQPTTFEVGTAFAFLYFARGFEEPIELAVVEVGTGGRFDATNVLEPLVSVITPISYDHTPTLGNTLSEIAWHKAGILRPGRPGVLAPQVDEARLAIEREADALGNTLDEVGREWVWSAVESEARGSSAVAPIRIASKHAEFEPLVAQVGLLGDHQRDNATTAVAALYVLGGIEPRFAVSRSALQSGLTSVDWPGRLQVISARPLVVLDGAHNASSAAALRAALESAFAFDRLHLVVGISAGKDARGVLDAILADTSEPNVYLTRSDHERSAVPADLEALARAAAPGAQVGAYASLPAALEAATAAAGAHDLVLVTGSLFLVGEALVWWRRSPR